MKVLILAKSYNQPSSARAIQMRRVIDALRKYTEASIILVTHGNKSHDSEVAGFRQINIESLQKTTRLKQRFFAGKSNFDERFIKNATHTIEDIIRTQHIDVLLTVSTPVECHEIGLVIKRKYPLIKWVTFFSDLWPSHLVPRPLYRRKLGSKLDIEFMKNVTSYCDILVTPSKYTLDILKENIPDIKSRLETISHTSRETISSKIENALKGFIIHSGFLQKERINEELVLAIKDLESEPLFKGFIHVGRFHRSLAKLIKRHNCKKIYLFGSVPEELSGLLQSMVEISIIIEAPMRNVSPFLPSKITDAILFSEKVVSISPERSELADMSKKWPGIFTSTYKKEEIVKAIKTALGSKEIIPLELIVELSPKAIAEKYILLFKS